MGNSFKEKAEKRRNAANNPAMMFISQPQAEEPRETVTLPSGVKLPKMSAAEIDALEAGIAERAEALEQVMRDHPLQAAQPMRAPQGREAKTRRLQLLLTPSLYEAVKRRAEADGLSVNETISELIQTALSE